MLQMSDGCIHNLAEIKIRTSFTFSRRSDCDAKSSEKSTTAYPSAQPVKIKQIIFCSSRNASIQIKARYFTLSGLRVGQKSVKIRFGAPY